MLAFYLILWLKANSYNFEIKQQNLSDPGHIRNLYVVCTNFKGAKLNKGWEAPLPIEQAQGTLQGAELYNAMWGTHCKVLSRMWVVVYGGA